MYVCLSVMSVYFVLLLVIDWRFWEYKSYSCLSELFSYLAYHQLIFGLSSWLARWSIDSWILYLEHELDGMTPASVMLLQLIGINPPSMFHVCELHIRSTCCTYQ